MRCARGGCRRRADVAVDFGEGVLVVFCYQDAVVALVGGVGRRIVRQLVAPVDVTIRPREA